MTGAMLSLYADFFLFECYQRKLVGFMFKVMAKEPQSRFAIVNKQYCSSHCEICSPIVQCPFPRRPCPFPVNQAPSIQFTNTCCGCKACILPLLVQFRNWCRLDTLTPFPGLLHFISQLSVLNQLANVSQLNQITIAMYMAIASQCKIL